MKFKIIILGVLSIFLNIYSNECVKNVEKDLDSYGRYLDKKTYLNNTNHKITAIRDVPPNNKPVIVRYLIDGRTRDMTFGQNGMIEIPSLAKSQDLELKYNPYTDIIFVVDIDKGDVIVFNKNGVIKQVLKGKDEHGNIDSNVYELNILDEDAADEVHPNTLQNLQESSSRRSFRNQVRLRNLQNTFLQSQANLNPLASSNPEDDNLPLNNPVLERG